MVLSCQLGSQFCSNINYLSVTPKFKETSDGPRDVNVTERDSITFNCSTVAKPNANVAWIRNGQLIDGNSTCGHVSLTDFHILI